MKTRCIKCGKHGEVANYSFLCPRCETLQNALDTIEDSRKNDSLVAAAYEMGLGSGYTRTELYAFLAAALIENKKNLEEMLRDSYSKHAHVNIVV